MPKKYSVSENDLVLQYTGRATRIRPAGRGPYTFANTWVKAWVSVSREALREVQQVTVFAPPKELLSATSCGGAYEAIPVPEEQWADYLDHFVEAVDELPVITVYPPGEISEEERRALLALLVNEGSEWWPKWKTKFEILVNL